MTPQRSAGFLLLPVSLLLIVIAAVSLGLVLDVGGAARSNAREAERARQLAEAGIAHATWKLNQLTTCSNYTGLPATTLGSDQYQVTVSPSSGAAVTLTATATLASGLAGSRVTVKRQIYKTAGATLTYTLKTDTQGGDTYLDAANPTKNYGATASLPLQQGSTSPLLRFDLSSLPKGSRIVDAQLSLYRESAGNLSLSLRTVDAYRVLESWAPGTKNGSANADGATIATRDGSTAWQSAGATVESVSALDSTHYHSYFSPPTTTWSITSLVQGWVDGRYPNYGLMLAATSSFSGETYASAEATDSTRVPKLIIKYVAPCGATNPPQDGVTGRVAWWKFNETSGATAADAVAAHTGALTGGSWVATGGVSGSALNFASAGKVTVTHTADLSQTGDFSLAAWINMSDRNGKRPVIYKGTVANEANYAMGTRDGEFYFEYFANNAWQTFTTSGLNLRVGTFYHLAATYKASTRQIKLYVDGAQVGTFTATSGNTPVANTRNLLIGSTPYNESFLGRLDDVQLIASILDLNSLGAAMGGSVRTPVADSQVSGFITATGGNYGASTPLSVMFVPDVRPLFLFNLSSIPAGTVIKRAIISFHVENSLSPSLNFTARLYPLTESWVEGTDNAATSTGGVTWVKRQTSPSQNWTTQGGTYANTLVGTLALPFGAATQRYWEIDITSTVQEWVDGIRPNYGLIMLMPSSLDSATLSSREVLHQEPRLVISTQ